MGLEGGARVSEVFYKKSESKKKFFFLGGGDGGRWKVRRTCPNQFAPSTSKKLGA